MVRASVNDHASARKPRPDGRSQTGQFGLDGSPESWRNPPSSRRDAVLHLAQHVAYEIGLMREFLVILDEEHRALSKPGGVEALAATTAGKTLQADKLAAAAQTRAVLLAALGFADALQDLSPVCRQYPDLRPAIDTLVALAGQARARNQENGIMIQTYQRHHQDAVLAWQSLSGRQESRLYDARGRSKPAGGRFKTHVAVG